MRHANILRLSAVDAAAQRPTSVGISAVVHVTALAEEAFAAESLDIDRHAVADPDMTHLRPDRLDDADHLVTDGDTLDGAGHAAVFDMQVAGADARERHAHDSVARILQGGFRLVEQLEPPVCDIGIGFHRILFSLQI